VCWWGRGDRGVGVEGEKAWPVLDRVRKMAMAEAFLFIE